MIIHLDNLERHSSLVVLLMRQLEVRLQTLRTKCGAVQDKENSQRDATLTAVLRGQILEVKLLIAALNPENDEAESPQF